MQPVKETVIVVHGTFSAKVDEGTSNWYAPNQDFANNSTRSLKTAIQTRGVGHTPNPVKTSSTGMGRMTGDQEPKLPKGCAKS